MLVAAAAKLWGVDAAGCTTENGKVLHAGSGKSAGYGELCALAGKVVPPAGDQLKLKDRSSFRIVGKPTMRVDNPDVVVGAATDAMDVKVEGMLYAVISASRRLARRWWILMMRMPGRCRASWM